MAEREERNKKKQKVKTFIIDYIQREYTVPGDIDIMALNYIEAGYVDSLGMIQFITSIEDEFGIAFEDDELEKPEMKVVGSLISIIEARMGE